MYLYSHLVKSICCCHFAFSLSVFGLHEGENLLDFILWMRREYKILKRSALSTTISQYIHKIHIYNTELPPGYHQATLYILYVYAKGPLQCLHWMATESEVKVLHMVYVTNFAFVTNWTGTEFNERKMVVRHHRFVSCGKWKFAIRHKNGREEKRGKKATN